MTGSTGQRQIGRQTARSRADRRSAILLPRRNPGHIGPFGLGQLLVVEIAATAVLVILGHGYIASIAAAAFAVVLFVVTLSRRQGRWWLEHRLMWRRYKRRTASHPAATADPRLAALHWLAPGLTVSDLTIADSSHVGVARDDSGWYAVAALEPDVWPPLDALGDALRDADQPGGVVQIVVHTVPAMHAGVDPNAPAGRSYQQLLEQLSASVPVDRMVWVAARLDARSLAESGAFEASRLSLAPAATAGLIRRVTKTLRTAGVRHQVLDAERLIAALGRTCDLDGTAPEAPREEWSVWRSPSLVHRTFWLSGWPRLDQASAFVEWLGNAPAVTTTLSITLAPDGDFVDLRCLVRVAAPADQIAQVCRQVIRYANDHDAHLFPLDGEQAPAVYATAPTGGGPR